MGARFVGFMCCGCLGIPANPESNLGLLEGFPDSGVVIDQCCANQTPTIEEGRGC